MTHFVKIVNKIYPFNHSATGLPTARGHILVSCNADVRGRFVEFNHIKQSNQTLNNSLLLKEEVKSNFFLQIYIVVGVRCTEIEQLQWCYVLEDFFERFTVVRVQCEAPEG